MWAPRYSAHADDKKRARLNIITHRPGQEPYEPIHRAKVTLPDRDEPGDYIEAHLARRYIPTPF